jgi:hypothetical protein
VDGSLRVEMADAEPVVFAQVVNNTCGDSSSSVFVISDRTGDEEEYQDDEDYTEAT